MTTMFGITSNKIVEIKNPYRPTEILGKFNEETTAFITVVGEKDEMRLGGNYFQKWNNKTELEGYRDKGYVYVSPAQPNAISGTDVRNNLGKNVDDNTKLDFFSKRAYPKFNKKIYHLSILLPPQIMVQIITTHQTYMVGVNILLKIM